MGKFKIDTDGVMASLMNDESKQENEHGFRIFHIDIDEIKPNERNEGISMPGIDDLAENIRLVGLEQNLVVSPKKDGMYKLQTGHRRLAALKMLVSNGYEEFRSVPCVIYDPDKFQYILSDENKEALMWVSSNIMTRKPTPQDLLKFTETLNEVYADLRANNPGIVLGTKKDYIAKELNISPSQVQILNSINSHLIEPAFSGFLSGELSLIVARDLAKLSDKDQKSFLDLHQNLSEISGIEIELFKKQKKDEIENKNDALQPYSHETSFAKLNDIMESIELYSEKAKLTPSKALKAEKITNNIYKNMEELLVLLQKAKPKKS